MPITISIMQLLHIAVYVFLSILVWKVKNKKIRIFIIILMLGIFTFNPIRFKQEGMTKIERRHTKIVDTLPERIFVKTKAFKEKQTRELEELKNDSKGLLDD